MSEKKEFEVIVRYTFDVKYKIKSKSKLEAETHAIAHCGLVLGGNIHSTLPDDDVDWEASVHPEKKLIK